MAISLLHISLPTSVSNTGSQAFTITTSTGNLMIIGIILDLPMVLTSVTDNKGQTYLTCGASGSTPSASNGGGESYIYYFPSAATGITTITVNFTGGPGGVSIIALDCSSTTGGAVDTANAQSAQTSASLTASLSASAAGICLAVFATLVAQTGTVTSPFTIGAMDFSAMFGADIAAYDVNASGGTLNVSFSVNAQTQYWSSVIAEFIEVPAAVQAGWRSPTLGPSMRI